MYFTTNYNLRNPYLENKKSQNKILKLIYDLSYFNRTECLQFNTNTMLVNSQILINTQTFFHLKT